MRTAPVIVTAVLALSCAQTFRFNQGRDELTFKAGGLNALNDSFTRHEVEGVEYEVQARYHPYELRPAEPDDVNSQVAIWGLGIPLVPAQVFENYMYAAFVRPVKGSFREPQALIAALREPSELGAGATLAEEQHAGLTGLTVTRTEGKQVVSIRALAGAEGLLLQIHTSTASGAAGAERAEAWGRDFFASLRRVDGATAPPPSTEGITLDSRQALRLALQPLVDRSAAAAR